MTWSFDYSGSMAVPVAYVIYQRFPRRSSVDVGDGQTVAGLASIGTDSDSDSCRQQFTGARFSAAAADRSERHGTSLPVVAATLSHGHLHRVHEKTVPLYTLP